jgi:hypothetical protein
MGALRPGGSLRYPTLHQQAGAAALAVREIGPSAAPKPRRLDRVREAIRARHYSRRTEKTYVAWIRRYIFFHGKRHPAEMGAPEITRFLTSLAVESRVAASTQNQALSALPLPVPRGPAPGSPVAGRGPPGCYTAARAASRFRDGSVHFTLGV